VCSARRRNHLIHVTALSVIDLSPVTTATPASAALRNSLDLAELAERLGYARYWFAEHHNLASIASSAPEIMIGRTAAATKRIRVGSGGVMLVNHAPLMVAERFKALEALFPGRIDLGLGRAPGTDPVTSYALRRRQDAREEDDFLDRFQELILLERGGLPEGHPFRSVHAVPADVALPPIWLLGSSGYSAELAAAVGMGFAFAHHFADYDPVSAMLSYREHFRPSPTLGEPYAILAAAVIAADTDTEAERIATSADLHFVNRSKGIFLPLASPEEAAAYPYTAADRERISRHRTRLFVGSVATLTGRLRSLIQSTRADELMITTMVYDHAARRRSYELLADAFALGPAA
jgi:luciferase family oxidoreductase group 1